MCKNYILRMLILDKYLLHANTQPLISFIDIYYKKKILCVPNYSIHELLVREAHESGLIGHFEVAKTLDIL